MRIAIISDTHLAAQAADFRQNLREAVAWIAAAGVDLVIHLGDVTANGVIHAAQFAAAAAALGELGAPLLAVPGNHDIGEPGGGHEPPFSPERLKHFRAAFGADRWMRDCGAWTLIGVNAQLLGTGADAEAEQLDWLRRTARSARGPVALFLHKPWFDTGPTDPSFPTARYVPAPSRAAMSEALAGVDLRLVASGHVHQFRRRIIDGVEHAWIGSTAFVIPERWQATIGRKETGVALLTLDGDSFSLEDVRPARMRDLDLADYADVYPELLGRD